MPSVEDTFTALGGQFLTPAADIAQKYAQLKAFIFDWDGVFNNGIKYSEAGSLYSEADSMGTNMLRFDHWLLTGHLPHVFIITGANNTTSIKFAKREHFDAVFINCKNKREALAEITEKYGLESKEAAFVFDDILDVDLATKCGLSFAVKRSASPLFTNYLVNNNVCDYITAHKGRQHAVREISELLMGLNGSYDQTISKRIQYEGDYLNYLSARNSVETIEHNFKQ
jgi:3-deoxy-D-manno-octulosonate 8-phosphate phosphatase (KDO 8-P phosphatase)